MSMKNMNLHNIAAACGGELRLSGDSSWDAERQVSAAVLDSRKVVPGALFFATKGERADGHKFIVSVFQAGAACVVTEKTPEAVEEEHGVPASEWGAYILVKSTLQALKDIAEYYRTTLTIPVIGITGSVGKTSTKEFIAGVLSEKYRVLKTEGNFNNEIGLPLTLLRIRETDEAAVVEMGISDFGEMHRLSKIARPNICVITNIGQCHLENLKSRDGILRAKAEIFDYMDPDGQVCLNGEDDKLAAVTEVHGKKTHFFGLGENKDEEVYAKDIVSRGLFGSEALLCMTGSSPFRISVPLPGVHMVTNAAAAACVARLLGLTPEQIAAGIARTAPVGGRSHLIRLPHYTLIDDCYNANPVSMKAAIDLLNMADTRKAAVLGDMFELGGDSDEMHAQLGEYAARSGINTIICIGENAKHIYKGAAGVCLDREAEGQRLLYYQTKADFLEALEKNGEEIFPDQDTILLKASHGMGFTELVEAICGREEATNIL